MGDGEAPTAPLASGVAAPMPSGSADSYMTVGFPAGQAPILTVVIDCEEDFDWGRPLRGTPYDVESTRRLDGIQRIFAEFGVVPTYVVGYPIVDHETAWQPLLALLQQQKCTIGAHLHPWVTPPHLETSDLQNSFAGNLPASLELAKLRVLTDRIVERFGHHPVVYKAGRYGFGAGTIGTLREMGFHIDVSFMPHWSYALERGPDFLDDTAAPCWLDAERTLLELPVTVGFTGAARRLGPRLFRKIDTPAMRALRVPSVLSRTGLLNRVRLTPEGIPLKEAKALTRALLKDGHRVFQMAFHSTSLVPGSTPYVRNDHDLEQFMGWIRGYLEFFFTEQAGVPMLPEQVLRLAGPAPDAPAVPAQARAPMRVLLCCNASYIQHLAVLITSLAEQPTRYRLDIVVVMSEARETDIAPLHASLARYDHLTLTVRSFVPDADVHLPLRIHYSRDIYTRLWVATFFDETVDRVLYLDCDMVVVGSLDPLWEADLHGRTVGAVGIPGSTRGAHLGMAGDAGYFNSGVMVIDLARWRRLSVFDRLMAYIGDNSEKLIDPDQDALNVTLEDDRTLLGYEWNVTSPFYFDYHDLRMASTEVSRIRAAARIIHFNGTSKPWSFFSQHPRRDDYFNFLALTSWRGFRPADRTPLNRLRRLATALMPEKLRRLLRRRLMN